MLLEFIPRQPMGQVGGASALKTLTPELQHYADLDQRLVEAARPIKVLSALTWPAHLCDEFIRAYEKGEVRLPQVTYPKVDYADRRRALLNIVQECDTSHPVGRYVAQTASSYVIAARMLENVGRAEFRIMSEILYGNPTDHLGKLSNLDLADDFIKITSDFASAVEGPNDLHCILPEAVASELKQRADAFFTQHKIDVIIDYELASKAAAGSERVRIRGQTSFSQGEIDQLLEHELFVHSATMLSGRAQPYLKSFGLGAPRTTGTQEGIATFAEMITATMDLTRLRRIALRIKGIHVALEGGDFVDVFRFFMASGQSPKESFQSAARIFRGGDVNGKNVFTKDVVYLKGLVSVQTFLRKAIEMRKIEYPQSLFIGRIALGDVISLEEFIQSGFIAKPLYQPKWVANRDALAAYLTYSVFTNQLKLSEIKLDDFVDGGLLDHIEGSEIAKIGKA